MKGIVIVSRFWTVLFSAGRAAAVTIFPFIFVAHKTAKADMVLLNHERIHLRQAIELLVLPFYVWYVLEFLIRYLRCRDFQRAYLHISFEKEAYAQERDLTYLKKRKFCAFMQYF